MGVKMIPHRSGALWLPDFRTAILADLHLGYTWAQRRRGELGPLDAGGATERLRVALDELRPSRVILLGDLYHAPRPSAAERRLVEDALSLVTGELVLVRGNHDRRIERDFAKAAVPEWRAPGLIAVHGDAIPESDDLLILGHFHPVVKLRDAAGAWRRYPAFVIGPRICLLPALSDFSVGTLLKDVPVEVGARPKIFALTKTRVVQVAGPRRARGSPASSPG
jgi:metallophosphoesterase superfamily enzyme